MRVLASKYYSDMRIYLLLLVPLLIWGCEQTYDEIIDSGTDNYQVSSILAIKDTIDLRKEPADSLFNPRLNFTPPSQVYRAYFDVYASDNSKLNSAPLEMNKIIEDLYEGQFILKREYPNGNYTVRFYAEGFEKGIKQVALGKFYFKNGQDNLPPVIANTVIEPDTVVVTQPTVIFASVDASDPNGLSDILEVYFIVHRPDGTSNNSKIMLFDDGNTSENGDLVAGDGTYSLLIQVDQSNQKGTYRFEFQAKDRIGDLSNIINHFVLIQ